MITKQALYTVVRDQLAEFTQLKDTVPRERLSEVVKFTGRSALVVKGIRRCGKSTLLKQAMKARFRNDFYYFNFDDERVLGFEAADFQTLIEVFMELFGKKKALFFDEIQNVAGWELFVNRMLREGYFVFITGSSADLLSRELGTKLTGRHTDIELFPFSFREFLAAKKVELKGKAGYSTDEKALLSGQFKEYLVLGGMPEAIAGGNPAVLTQVVGDIIQKDIIRRYAVRKPNELRSVLQFLISNASNKATFRSISANFRLKSAMTVQKYIGYAEQAYLLFAVGKFERKLKLLEKSPKKIYCIDNGIAVKNSAGVIEKQGALLENLVAIELFRRGVKPHYYVTKGGYETDFVIVAGEEAKKPVAAMQVCSNPVDAETMKREEKALEQTLIELNLGKGTVITMDFESVKRVNKLEIEYVPAWKWLLQSQN